MNDSAPAISTLFVLRYDNECLLIDARIHNHHFHQVANFYCETVNFFAIRHFSAPKRKHKTIKSCFSTLRCDGRLDSSVAFHHLITNRFQLLGERKLPKKDISRQIIEHREKSSGWTLTAAKNVLSIYSQ